MDKTTLCTGKYSHKCFFCDKCDCVNAENVNNIVACVPKQNLPTPTLPLFQVKMFFIHILSRHIDFGGESFQTVVKNVKKLKYIQIIPCALHLSQS